MRINWASFAPYSCTSCHPIGFSLFSSCITLGVFLNFNFSVPPLSLSLSSQILEISMGITLASCGPFHCTQFHLSTIGCNHSISNFWGFSISVLIQEFSFRRRTEILQLQEDQLGKLWSVLSFQMALLI